MTDRERLIELLYKKYDHFCDQCGVNKDSHYVENLADYLLANGVIVPAYNIGDTVYIVDKETSDEVEELHIEGIEALKYEGLDGFVCFLYRAVMTSGKLKGFVRFAGTYANRAVFLTREEAEKALKGGVE